MVRGVKKPSKPANEPVRSSNTGQGLAFAVGDAPCLADPKAARDRLSEWLSEIGSGAAGKSIKQLIGEAPGLEALLLGLADGSPYLWDLATAEPDRLLTVLTAEPGGHLAALLAKSAKAVATAADEATAMQLLRRMKAEAALLIAMADIGGVWPVMRTTQALTEVADTAVSSAVRYLLREAAANGKLKPAAPDAPEADSGYIVLAMGKMGAYELNYSSDIDLIVFYDREAPALVDKDNATTFHVRITRGVVKLLQERTADGYVFRVDLRLRPDPASTQIAVSVESALNYYSSVGQNWERAAMIKARVCAGDVKAGEDILAQLSPFIWRKYLDFAAVAEIESLKRQIHAYRGHADIAVEGHNIKLGRGGIREIEFFVQTQQLVAGGRHPELRGRQTLPMLTALAEGGWIGEAARIDLEAAYLFLRETEHRLQMVADDQTHTLPAEREALDRFARFAGFKDRDEFAETLLGHLRQVQGHYIRLFEETSSEASRLALTFPKDADDRETLNRLGAMGFRKPLEVSATVRDWFHGSYKALRGEFARSQFADLVPSLLERLARSEHPEAAITAFDTFIRGLERGSRLFSMLKQNPDLVTLVALTIGTAPRLADILARHPEAMDALLEPTFFGALPNEATLDAELARLTGQDRAYEDYLDRLRMFSHEQMFLIGARILSGTVSAEQAGGAFARIADVTVRALHRRVEEMLAERHGRIPGQQTVLLALGKLGGWEMTATSDLDLIIVYDFDAENPQSDGEKALYGAQYFARLTQRLIAALSSQTNYGALYNVDMRLRPSGRSGPIATSIEAFKSYQEVDAWTWEHMALTRARVVAGPPEFAARVSRVIKDVLRRERDPATVAVDVADMRQAIAQEKGEDQRWDLKYAAGGLIDIEFIAQHLQLVHAAEHPEILDTNTARVLDQAWRLELLSPQHADVLRPAVRLYHNLTQVLRLCLPGPFDPKTAGKGLLDLLCRAADLPNFATLNAHVAETQQKVRATFNQIVSAG
ncbi:bifunctional [glutamine synthetase] adenylyltransferase/[glutamine synthetase]-adenylyl-L-tyrosine phosphorylase [Rhodoplanes sp. Z2-YC6860]|uniref:bifunctional [glutamine synthetase] adenylyltransferase/[glutamine synthetase]-adenylyl-L-tyrosine phosphorylase n=1 Tax=Rhodoplanes sp. Z2-YC6860 TaxID=674703 RepID=UPI00078B6077|nr:bifunctional [glutamine synthetase] adenylyltransferase/[glutamine synthetase]-adenylyl-L-tyrosine phosphorylase [Rhodoplanes sp. Z2-YC6860]AMN41440.1 glutamate-ammonia-ligase adenylyltransferase [Rhodoplanes sp. Z2-YC6860]